MADPAADRQALVEVINLGLLWHCLQIQLEHTPVRDSVVPGSVHPPGQVADVVGAGDAGQEGKHDVSVPTRRF